MPLPCRPYGKRRRRSDCAWRWKPDFKVSQCLMPSGRLFRNATRQHDHSTCLLDIVAEIDDTRCMQAVICQPALHHMSVHRKRILCAVGRPDVPSRVRPVRPPSAADEYLRWRLKLAERRLACLYRKRHSAPDCVTRTPSRQARSYPSHSSYDVSAAMSPAFREAAKYRINMLSIHIATKLYK